MARRKRLDDVLPGQQRLALGVPAHHQVRLEYRRCGRSNCSRCGEGKPGHGPYRYAVWRDGKRVRRKYLGTA